MPVDTLLDVIVHEEGRCIKCDAPVDGPGDICRVCRLRAEQTRAQADEVSSAAARRELARRELARRRLMAFTQYMRPDYVAGWFHKDLAARLERFLKRVRAGKSPRLLINVPPRRGKLCSDDTPVLTTRGWTYHGSLRVGDEVYGRDGTPVRVLQVHEPDVADYRIEFTDGAVVDCSAEHEWALYDYDRRKEVVLETREIAAARPKRYGLPLVPAIEMPEARFGESGPYDAGLRAEGTSELPAWLAGSVAQREAFLAGVIDATGTIDNRGNVSVTSTNLRMVRLVANVARSLGWRPGVYYSHTGASCKVQFVTDRPLPLRSKLKDRQKPRKSLRRRTVRSVTRLARPKRGRCITVDAPDGVYLVGRSLVPTHNSELTTKAFVAWAFGHVPSLKVISATHSDRLALDNSRDVLGYMKDERYRQLFPGTELDPDNKGAMGWRTLSDGMYKPVGAGAGISGYGADILLIDDPHRDKDAYSQVVRDAIWRWYRSSASTRLLPGGGVILIQTRWVLDDLTGRLIDEEGLVDDGGVWELVCYPEEAVADEYRLRNGRIVHEYVKGAVLLRRKGEVLHPERYPPESNVEHKKDPVTWAALYQQNPVAGEAAMFQREWFPECRLADVPTGLVKYSAWDTAVGQSQNNAYTAGVVGGVDADDNLWIVDVRRKKLDGMDIVEEILDVYEQHREDATGIERTNHAVAVQPFLEKRVSERGLIGINVVELLHGNKDKVARARPIQARAKQGKVMIPVDAPWYEEFMRELLDFPAGRTADMVDAFAHLGQMLDLMSSPYGAPVARRETESWRNRLHEIARGQSRRRRSWRAA